MILNCAIQGACRTSTRCATRYTLNPAYHRWSIYSRSLSTRPTSYLYSLQAHKSFALPSQYISRRLFSLGSIFSRPKPTPHPSPFTVAHITRLEAEANANPQDVEKQLALFQALLQSEFKAGYEVVISRWERMCEFDSSSPLLQSDPAFQVYLTCLLKTGSEASIPAAVRRRESLLGQTTVTSKTENASVLETEASSTSAGVKPNPLSKSQEIAQAVLAGKNSPSIPGTANAPESEMSKLALAFQSSSANTPVQVSIVERKGAWAPRLARFLFLTCVGSFFILIILSVLLDNTGLIKVGPRQAEFLPSDGKTVKFSDIHGVDEAKEELKDVVAFLKDPTAFASLGGKLPKGVLLTGHPGTGKTMLARAVAGEAGVPFFFASGSDFEEMYVGVGAKRVRDLFAAARKKEPAIIFIDELDAVGGKRSSRDQQYMKQTLNQLLVEMDGFMQNEGVIVIAATNFPESLDQALVRPGRFDRHIAVPLPDVRGRVQILKHHMKGVTCATDVDPTVLARGTPGFSGADLQNMINQAAIQASKEGATQVTSRHFEWAKDRIVMGAERKSAFIDREAKLLTAYHEGGHALVALYTDGAMPLHKVTCVPRGHALGVTSQLPKDDRFSVSLKEYKAEIDVCMGGRVAEELIYGREFLTSGASSDIRHATSTATAMVKSWGMSTKIGPVSYGDRDSISPVRREQIEDEIRDFIQQGEARVINLLTERKEELHRLAHALVEYETLDADEVRKVVKGEPIRNITEILKEELELPA